MASTDRSALPDVTLGSVTSSFNFFQLVELLNRLDGTDQERDLDRQPGCENIRFKACASLGFPSSDVLQFERDNSGRHELEVAFLGLHGSQSPMPGYYLDSLAWEYAQGEQRLGLFLDFFHHRLLTLLHRIWRKYRYHIRFQEDGEDGFSRLIFSLLGMGNQALCHEQPLNRARMFSYAGLLASPARSPDVVATLVAHCFELTDVEVIGWQRRKVAVHPDQQNRLGRACSTLGGDFVIGDKVNDCAGKFLLKLNGLSFSQFLGFLPGGENFHGLVSFVSFVLRDQLAWDLRLGFGLGQVSGLRLGEDPRTRLGWNTFLGEPPEEAFVTICVQE